MPITTLRLSGGSFAALRGQAPGAARAALARGRRERQARRTRKKPPRKLWGDGRGRFRTRGRYGAATVRGTKWLTDDRCDGTFVARRARQGRRRGPDPPAAQGQARPRRPEDASSRRSGEVSLARAPRRAARGGRRGARRPAPERGVARRARARRGHGPRPPRGRRTRYRRLRAGRAAARSARRSTPRRARVRLTVARDDDGGTWRAVFSDGQVHRDPARRRASRSTTLTLTGPTFRATCGEARPRRGAAGRKRVRRLWGDGHGRFRTVGPLLRRHRARHALAHRGPLRRHGDARRARRGRGRGLHRRARAGAARRSRPRRRPSPGAPARGAGARARRAGHATVVRAGGVVRRAGRDLTAVPWVEVFAVLLVCHAVGDFLLQTEWQATHKRGRARPRPGAPPRAASRTSSTYTLAFAPALAWLAGELGAAGTAALAAGVALPHLVQDDGRAARRLRADGQAHRARARHADARRGPELPPARAVRPGRGRRRMTRALRVRMLVAVAVLAAAVACVARVRPTCSSGSS